jgi:hypothetical protein
VTLAPVVFDKHPEKKPRISAPYVPGKHSPRFWTGEELALIREHYPIGGMPACLQRLPPHRTKLGIYQQAQKMKLTAPKYGGPKMRIEYPPGFDDALRKFYEEGDGHKKGECNSFADKMGLPRWWVTKRATKLGLVMPHKKEPPWSAAEIALLKRAPVHDLRLAAKMFREHGFSRSETAINVMCKRQEVSRRAARPTLSATAIARILGVDSKGVTSEILRGELKGVKRLDKRSPQQGGSAWDVTRADLRAYIIEHLERIDFRKVDKFELVAILVQPAAEAPP